jgi:diguanylate cyclase (GGDEF)-like protein/PAS domain S-box-containing protein
VTKAQTRVIPFLVGSDLIGVLKIEGLHIGSEALKQQLPTFFNYVALLLKNEILGHTRLQKAYSQLRESTERFMAIFEQAPLGIALIDSLTGHIYEVNPKFAEIAGRTRSEIVEIDWMSITHPDDVQEDLDNMALLNAGKIPGFDMRKRYIRPDGSFVWISMTIAPIKEEDQTRPRHLCMIEDITDRKRMEEEILALSITDQLTGLHNRRGFLSLTDQQLKLAERNKRGMLLFFADLDGLKWINDTLGHEEGYKSLMEAATVFKETFRTSDIIARLGGDEYAVLAVDINKTDSEIFTARLQSLIDTRNNQESRRYRLSISVGCSCYDPENPSSIEELMASADKLMYEYKQKKKGTLPQKASLSNGIQYQAEID